MEQRLANTWRISVNEKKFIESALQSDLRIDGRCPFDYRRLTIKFGREDGSSEVQLGQTHVMGFVTSELVQPFRDRPNEGTLAIYTEFSPMADPSFEVGRPGESAVEVARIIDRGLRESRAVDTESLCVVAGKLVWSIRLDIHILDNGGNLVDAANIAALAALLTFRRPECSVGGEDGQEVVIHPPEAREPLPLIVHHLPIAVTFAFIGSEDTVVIDPTHLEEAVMGGRMTATLNMNGDVCAIQKAGGDGIMQSVILQCLRIASVKAVDITTKIKIAVESYNTERALRKVKRHTSTVAVSVGEPDQNHITDFSRTREEKLKLIPKESIINQNDAMDVDTKNTEHNNENEESKVKNFAGGSSSWTPNSKGIDAEELRAPLSSQATTQKPDNNRQTTVKTNESDESPTATDASHVPLVGTTGTEWQVSGENTLKNAVKPKHKRKKKSPSSAGAS